MDDRPAAQLLEELALIREQGYATSIEELRHGACSIAVPVFSADGTVGLSLGVIVPTPQQSTLPRHLPTLRGVAQRMTAITVDLPPHLNG